VVSGKIGNAVVRHRITRRLRPLVSAQLSGLSTGTDLVVRALPAAAGASSIELDHDLQSGLAAIARKAAGSRPKRESLASVVAS
jgi:ribonuclease P protein component